MANREESKEQRRRQIVSAARALMQQTGDAGFSMKSLADQADVSLATPYNLFGSKQSIMFAVLDADLAQYQTRLEKLRVDKLEVFFRAVTLATSLYATEPGFYKAVIFAIYNDGGREYRAMFSGPRHAMWKAMVQDAIDAGLLAKDTAPDIFAVHLGRAFFSCILEWVSGELTLAGLEVWVHYGFAIALRSMAAPDSAARLDRKLRQLQKRMKQMWRQHLAQSHQPANGQS